MKTERMSEQTFKIGDRVRVKPGWCRCHGGQEAEVKEVSKTAVRLKFPNAERPVMVGIEGVERVSPDEQADDPIDELAEAERAVVAEALAMDGQYRTAALHAACDRVEALRTHRTKPEPAPRCEPPAEFWETRFHWLIDETGLQIEPFEWRGTNFKLTAWSRPGGGADRTRDQMTRDGWSYYAPAIPVAKPETTALVEPDDLGGKFTDEDAAKVGRSLMDAIEANSDHVLLKDWSPAEDPAEIVADLLWAFDQKFTSRKIEASDDDLDRALADLRDKPPGPDARELFRFLISTFKPQAEKVEASDEAITLFLKGGFGLEGGYYNRLILAALRTFKPAPQGQVSGEGIGTISDEQIDALFQFYESLHHTDRRCETAKRAVVRAAIDFVTKNLTKFTLPKAGTLTDAEISDDEIIEEFLKLRFVGDEPPYSMFQVICPRKHFLEAARAVIAKAAQHG